MSESGEIEQVRTHAIGGGWGNHISWLDGGRAKPVGLDDGTVGQGPRRVYGHMSRRPRIGDRLTAEMQSGRTALFVFTEVKYERDPEDMFFGTVEFVEYVDLSGRPKCGKPVWGGRYSCALPSRHEGHHEADQFGSRSAP